jgi:argininosuccinate lyase
VSGEAGMSAVRLWGGRFETGPADALARLSMSVQFDWRLARYDLLASSAHARVLHRAGLLDDKELARLLAAIDELGRACRTGEFRPTAADEDVHTALERGLLERVGSLGGRLRAGRSRNDQVATDLRMYLRDHARQVVARLAELQTALMGQAGRHLAEQTPAPGMTHMQHAQPVLLAHQLLAHVQALSRDMARLRDWDKRAAICPLGSGALAGSSLPVDPEAVAAELGFDAPAANSMDAVADRDFAAEFCFAAALAGVHLSRLGEEVVLWTSHEFGWAEIDDAYATGSSIMPQKKNADVAELARGKAGRLIGGLTGLLTTLKGLPLTYNRDLQEDKEPVFDAVDTLLLVLPAMAGLVSSMQFRADRLARGAAAGHALATDVAELLVRRGVAFREAHEAVGHLVVWCQVNDCELGDVSDEDLQKVSPHLTPDVRSVLSVSGAIAARDTVGGTAPGRVADQLAALRLDVAAAAAWAAEG